ncbi:succinate dehydrogenase/fumarate reductase iron-sulfur subunit [Thermodesulfobacteriota bacterium]
MEEKIKLKIRRYNPKTGKKPRFENFTLVMDPNMSVLDALEIVRTEQDSSLLYRHSCHHSSCGTCGMIINGKERLACVTPISQLKKRPITLEPLSGFPAIGDLAVDMTSFYKDIDDSWDYLRALENLENRNLPEGIGRFERFENCIECGCCFSACPASGPDKPFMGPAALAAVNTELGKSKGNEKGLLDLAGSERGEKLCERALACNRVCETLVYPARHILDLRKRLSDDRWES